MKVSKDYQIIFKNIGSNSKNAPKEKNLNEMSSLEPWEQLDEISIRDSKEKLCTETNRPYGLKGRHAWESELKK